METLSDHSGNNEDDDYAGTDDEIPPVPQELPPLDVDLGGTSLNQAEEEGDIGAILDAHAATTGAKSTQVRAKRVVRNPQPKLDPARLSGDRGLPSVLKHFNNVKFKGKGHEKEDLNVLMHKMEHWAHRLCPRMTFDEVIARVEKLGSKKPVQVCVKKIRLDLFDDDETTPQNMENLEGISSEANAAEKNDWDFDELFADRPMSKAAAPVEPDEMNFDDLFADPTTATPVAKAETQVPSKPNNTLTAEQLKIIEEKKNMAARRKAARMAEKRVQEMQQNRTNNTSGTDTQEESRIHQIGQDDNIEVKKQSNNSIEDVCVVDNGVTTNDSLSNAAHGDVTNENEIEKDSEPVTNIDLTIENDTAVLNIDLTNESEAALVNRDLTKESEDKDISSKVSKVDLTNESDVIMTNIDLTNENDNTESKETDKLVDVNNMESDLTF